MASAHSGPTPDDPGIAAGLQQAKLALAAVKGAQLADPDNGKDPIDDEVMAAINVAQEAIDKAIAAQAKDGVPVEDAGDDLTNPASKHAPKQSNSAQEGTTLNYQHAREKYDQADRDRMAKSGEAMPDGSYPIADAEDLDNAIHAVGRGNADHDTIRKHIIARAKALGLSSKIPDNWNADGSEKGDQSNSAEPAPERPALPAVVKRAFWSLTERPVPVAKVEMRAASDEKGAHFTGYASTTGEPYAVTDWLGEYRETIMPGAFAKTLREQGDVPLLFNHDGIPLASTRSGTSVLAEDAHGLRNDADLDRTDANTNSICVQMSRGVLGKMSFSFRAIRDDWNDSYDQRAVNELALFDTSIVTYPANPSTSAELRDAFREAMGREGVGVMYSARAALLGYAETRSLDEAAEPVLEQAVRVLAAADEAMCRRTCGPLSRSRTFVVAGLFEQVRAGKVLSAKNQQLLQAAADALAGASKAHAKVTQAHQKAADAIGQVLPDGSGNNNGAPAGEDPINPQDGAGPRSVPASVLKAQRQLAELRLVSRKVA